MKKIWGHRLTVVFKRDAIDGKNRLVEKNGKLCGNFRQYYAEESGDYAGAFSKV